MDVTPLIDKWINYGDAAVIAMIGQLGMQAYHWHTGQMTCTIRSTLARMAMAASMGILCKASVPIWLPAGDAIILGAGMTSTSLIARLRVTMPAWIIRLARGSGSPFD